MELRNINTFQRVAELRSFSRAAEQLGYSQSAVSAQIQQLEAELGVPLFDRVNKTVRLTGPGEQFARYAQQLLRTAQEALTAMRQTPAVSGVLRVALNDSLVSAFGAVLLARYHQSYPQVQVVLRTATTEGMLAGIEHNEIDLAYTLDQPITHAGLVQAVHCPEPVSFIAPANHPLARAKQVTLQQLAAQPFILTEHGMSYRDALDQRLAEQGLVLRPCLEMGSAELICQLVGQGLGLSFVPEYVLQPHLAAGRLARLAVPGCRVAVYRQLFYHKDKWLTPQMQAFIQMVQQDGSGQPPAAGE